MRSTIPSTCTGIILDEIQLKITTIIARGDCCVRKHSLLIVNCRDLCQFGFIVVLAQMNRLLAINFFNCLSHKESCISKSNFTCAIAKCLIFNEEFETDADVRYQVVD